MDEPYVHELFSGKVRKLGDDQAENPMERSWETGMFKETVEGKHYLTFTGLSGDEVADTKNHGGPDKAIFAYPIGHYTYFSNNENLKMPVGGMGENLAVLEMDELTVCIGDKYKFGEAIIEVSQPRQPCWKPARRFKRKELALKIQESGKTGWYFRVLKEGNVHSKVDLHLIERPYPQWSIAACNDMMHRQKDNLVLIDELASCPPLADSWKKTLNKLLLGKSSSIAPRVYGPNA
ncbi:MOSC domain-containing protein [Aciduricibacillus chroicocephali]|uniref:MOSC domain-containing protein n=1 Tax=Aciduricibacillus chroicocephali TaxID=3054939 RepID=A0ABY9KWV0_9BACI|nr:MOSC domain-containing protein [Bacillaceae bacterium 44XB]